MNVLLPHRRKAFRGGGFQFTWKTNNAGVSTSTQARIPTISTASYNCKVDWGDGNTDDITTWNDAAWTHTYSVAGTYTITITGTFERIYFNNGGDRLKILNIVNFGDVGWSSMLGAFYGCTNLTVDSGATNGLEAAINFQNAWTNCTSLTSFPAIDVSGTTRLDYAWYGCSGLTSFPLIDTSMVSNLQDAWRGCTGLTSFPSLNTGAVTIFQDTWYGCTGLTSFPTLDTSAGTNFQNAWYNCTGLTSFPLIDVSATTRLDYAWQNCSGLTSFPLIDASGVSNFSHMLRGCSSLASLPVGFGDSMGSGNNFTNFLLSVTINTTDYSRFLTEIEAVNSNSTVTFHGGSSEHTGAGTTARAALIADHSWSITDGGAA